MFSGRVAVLVLAAHGASAFFQSRLRGSSGHSITIDDQIPECYWDRMINFDFSANLHSNLGGHGPDSGPETLVMGDVLKDSGSVVDLQVAVIGGEYEPNKASKNGIYGAFGQVNLKSNREATFRFELLNRTSGGHAKMDTFLFSFFDFDTQKHGKGVESMHVSDFTQSWLEPNSEIYVDTSGNFTWFNATQFGKGDDNPYHPLTLTQDQKNKAVTLLMPAISSWTVRFRVTGGTAGRNFLFSGPTNLVCEPDRALCSTMVCPEGYGLIDLAEHTICHDTECTHAEDAARCCEELPLPKCEDAEIFDFSQSSLAHSNLGGMGPDSGAATLVFSDVYPKSGQVIDMVVSNLTEYIPMNTDNNMLRDLVPQVNIKCGTSVMLLIRFVDRLTGAAASLPDSATFSVYDLDHLHNGKGVESVEVDEFTSYYTSNSSEVRHNGPRFTGTEWGRGVDNPSDPEDLTELQTSRSVSFLGAIVDSEVKVTISATEGYRGRNFLFGGTAVRCA